jgi:mannose/fructose/N-acetylgalactosamine-specific phosphotransferase system component IID
LATGNSVKSSKFKCPKTKKQRKFTYRLAKDVILKKLFAAWGLDIGLAIQIQGEVFLCSVFDIRPAAYVSTVTGFRSGLGSFLKISARCIRSGKGEHVLGVLVIGVLVKPWRS